MDHTSSRGRWIPLAVAALLFSLVTLVAPAAAGAQATPTYTVDINGNCPATFEDSFTYTLVVTNNGTEPIEVVALERTFTVPAGATKSVEFPDEALGNGLQDSLRIDGERPEEFAVGTPACIAPLGGFTIEYSTPCPGDTGPGNATFTNKTAYLVEVTASDLTLTVEPKATLTMEVPAGLVADDFTIDGSPVPDGAFTLGADVCDEPPSSSDDAPSSSDDAPSSNDDAVPISAPLSPKFTG